MGREFYRPEPMAANAAYKVAGIHIGGFLATVVGTLTVTSQDGTVLLNALPVALGFNRLAMVLPQSGGAVVQLAGGAAGTLLV